MTEWKTVKKEDEYSTIFISAEDAPGLYSVQALPLPPHCTPTEGGCKVFVFVISQNFHEIFNFEFCEFN